MSAPSQLTMQREQNYTEQNLTRMAKESIDITNSIKTVIRSIGNVEMLELMIKVTSMQV